MKVPADDVSKHLLCPGLLAFLALLALALQGCTFYTMHGNPLRNQEQLNRKPPASLALMPVKDNIARQELDEMVRRSLYGALAPLHYKDVEIDQVDEALAALSLEKKVAPVQLAPQDVARKDLADALLYTEVVKRSRLWLLLYSHIKLRMKLTLMDPATNAVLYSNDATLYKRRFSLPTSISGIAQSWAETLWDLRNSEMENVFEEYSERIAKDFPDPVHSQTAEGGVDGVFVSVPGSLLRAGDTLSVEVRGKAGQKGWFDVGGCAKGLPLIEKTPGLYTGSYQIKAGDQDDTGIVQAHLQSPLGAISTMSNFKKGFRIDAVAPERPEIADVRFPKKSVSLHFRLPQVAGDTRFEIFRTENPKEGYTLQDQITGMTWVDRDVKPGRQYWYMVKALDAGGNPSMNSEPKMVGVPQKGPTILPTQIAANTVLHAYSSPYRVYETAVVGADASLTVEPGVEIQIWPGARIRIRGNAKFEGSAENPVRIIGKDGGTLIQFEPEKSSATIAAKNIEFKNALLALDAKNGSVSLEKAKFEDLVRGIVSEHCKDVQMLQCQFESVGTAVEGSAQKMDAQFCDFKSAERGISIDSPKLTLKNNDFHGNGLAVSQMNAAPAQVDDNFFETTDPIGMLNRSVGPLTFTRLFSKPCIEKQSHSLESASFDLCKNRGDGCMDRKDASGALAAYINAWWLRKDKTVGLRLVQLLKDSNRKAESLNVAHTLAVMEPMNHSILTQYAKSLDESGFTKEAVEVRKRLAQTSDSRNPEIAE